MFNITDVKQYVYCPRVIYFTYVMPVQKKTTFKMEFGRDEHRDTNQKEKRRGVRSYGLITGERLFQYELVSKKYNLGGKLDLLIDTGEEWDTKDKSSQRYWPVEFKYTTQPIQANIKYQLAAYALALEEQLNTRIEYGFIYTIPNKKAHKIKVTEEMKNFVQLATQAIKNIIWKEQFPEPRSRRRCRDCEFNRYCNDIY